MIILIKKTVAAICGFLPFFLSAEEFARGFVFEDVNGNEVRDSGEKGIPGIGVSDGSNTKHLSIGIRHFHATDIRRKNGQVICIFLF